MWIRNSLIIMPVVLLAVLFGSVAWVPPASEISADVSRLDKFVAYIQNDVKSLNQWFSQSAYDSDVNTYIQEGLASADGNLVPTPNLSKTIKVGEDVVIMLSPGDDAAAIGEALDKRLKQDFPKTYRGIGEFRRRDFQGAGADFENWTEGPKAASGDTKLEIDPAFAGKLQAGGLSAADAVRGRGADLAKRLLLRFRATEPDHKEHIPSAVVTDIVKRIDEVAESVLGRKAWAGGFDQWTEAMGHFMWLTGVEMELSAATAAAAPGVADAGGAAASDEEKAKAAKAEADARAEARKLAAAEVDRLAAAKHGDKAPKFASMLAMFPKARVSEHPVIECCLHDNIKWHDFDKEGKYCESEDVLFTMMMMLDPDVNTDSKTYVNSMLQFRMHDRLRFDIVYKMLYSPALFHLTYAKILPRHKFSTEEWTRQAIKKGRGPAFEGDPTYNVRKALPAQELEFQQNPVGTGPFKAFPLNGDSLPVWRSGELVRLERFDDYWNTEEIPAFKYFDFYVIDPDLGEESAEINFLAGGMDQYAVKPYLVDKYEGMRDRYYFYKRPNLQYGYFGFNLNRPVFKDLRVRQALTMAVDVDAIITAVYFGQGRRVAGPAYPMLPYYDEEYVPTYTFRQGPNKGKTLREAGERYFPFDLTEATALLEEAGWKKDGSGNLVKEGEPLKFELSYSGISSSPTAKICNLAVEQWRKLGAQVSIKELDFNTFIAERVMTRDFDMLNLGWNGGIDYDKRKLWSTSQVPPAGFNFTSFSNKRADELFDTMLKEYDSSRIITMSHEAFRLIADEQPYIFIATPYTNLAVDRHLYWAKTVTGPKGEVLRNPDGTVKREARSVVDDVLMDWKYGPRTLQTQHRRSDKILFPPSDDERSVVGEKSRFRDTKTAGKK